MPDPDRRNRPINPLRDMRIAEGLKRGDDPKEVFEREFGAAPPAVTNTATAVNAQPGQVLGAVAAMKALGAGDFGNVIENMEAAGQCELVVSDVLPIEMGAFRDSSVAARTFYEKLGFVFGEPVEGDPLFIHAKLPPGWKKRHTNHAMWSDIIDEKGRKRVGVFYKAAFYDRKAHMCIEPRYTMRDLSWSADGMTRTEAHGWVVIDTATGAEVMRSDLPKDEKAYPDPNYCACADWLEKLTPSSNDPSHWDGV